MSETHKEWFTRVTRGDSNRQVSDRAKISNVTLGRQLKQGELSADMIIKISQAYEESPVIALVDLGFISARWINEFGVTTSLTRASDEELTDELLRRLNLLSNEQVDELAQRRMSGAHGVMPDMAVADGSPDEDALREDGDWTDPDNVP